MSNKPRIGCINDIRANLPDHVLDLGNGQVMELPMSDRQNIQNSKQTSFVMKLNPHDGSTTESTKDKIKKSTIHIGNAPYTTIKVKSSTGVIIVDINEESTVNDLYEAISTLHEKDVTLYSFPKKLVEKSTNTIKTQKIGESVLIAE